MYFFAKVYGNKIKTGEMGRSSLDALERWTS